MARFLSYFNVLCNTRLGHVRPLLSACYACRRFHTGHQRQTKHKFDIEESSKYRELGHLEEGLDEEQRALLRLVLVGEKNVFFTGAAGTGKSHVLKRIIQGLEIKYLDDHHTENGSSIAVDPVGVTASTGIAAQSIGGTTLHRFAGIGTGAAPIMRLVENIREDSDKKSRWLAAKVLIIDEISMISADLFDKLDAVARMVREVKDKPFGGVQLVLAGDFFQLPPVQKKAIDDGHEDHPRFCFESQSWRYGIDHTVVLQRIYRQRDPAFTQMLNEIRYGTPSDKTIETFRQLKRPLMQQEGDTTEPVELYAVRKKADEANARRMARLPTETGTYTASEGGDIEDPETRARLLNDCIAHGELKLKLGAQVMLVKNIPMHDRLMNGVQGIVLGFASDAGFYEHQDAWENDPPTSGIHDVDKNSLSPLYPVVQFEFHDGKHELFLCKPMKWTVDRWKEQWGPWRRHKGIWKRKPMPPVKEVLASRTQVPLILSWALSIHKAQGQSLDLVRVDLGRIFESGQAYVALSRAKTIEGLQVLNFDPKKVYAHPKVKEFYDSLTTLTGDAKEEGGIEEEDVKKKRPPSKSRTSRK